MLYCGLCIEVCMDWVEALATWYGQSSSQGFQSKGFDGFPNAHGRRMYRMYLCRSRGVSRVSKSSI
jgi:hypothetical protein